MFTSSGMVGWPRLLLECFLCLDSSCSCCPASCSCAVPGELCVARLGSGEVLGPGLMGGEHSGEMEAACHKK